MLIYQTNGTIDRIDLSARKDRKVTLEELQAAVGGWIEAVPGTKARAYCNEEGRLIGLPVNLRASARFGQVLVGVVVELEKGDRQ